MPDSASLFAANCGAQTAALRRFIRGYGGIGRRARFRILCPGRAGSSPVTRTISSVHKAFDLWTLDFCFYVLRVVVPRFFVYADFVIYSTDTPLRVSDI